MENIEKSIKKSIMVRLKKDANPQKLQEICIKNGYTQNQNGVDMPNMNKFFNDLIDIVTDFDSRGININELINLSKSE